MRYLKLFEDIEDKLWREITKNEYEDIDIVLFQENKQEEILSLIQNQIDNDEIRIDVQNTSALMLKYFKARVHRNSPYYLIITIEMCDDYWYTVCIEEDYPIYYKCDDIIGVKQLLKDKDIID